MKKANGNGNQPLTAKQRRRRSPGGPAAVPRGFGTRTHELTPPGRDGPVNRVDLTRAELTAHSPRDRAPAGASAKDDSKARARRERERLAALAKEHGAAPQITVRPDYFGSAEHRAAAELLASILSGTNPFPRQGAELSPVLFSAPASPDELRAPATLASMTIASRDPGWREGFQANLRDLLAVSRPSTELEIRPGTWLRYGEIVALAGDYYATPEELETELSDDVVNAIRGVTPDDPGTFLLNTHRGWFDFLSLANQNFDHFCPRNWARYARHHREALLLALDRDLERALVRNAFADHFLTDAFASGHMREPRDLLTGLVSALPARRMHDEENEHGLWVRNGNGFVWRAFGDDMLGRNPVHLLMTAYAVGLSLKRVYRAYRLEGDAAAQLKSALQSAAIPDFTAGQPADPRTLPDFLGPVAGLDDIRRHLPVALDHADAPSAGTLVNYPPMVAFDGTSRQKKPDFDAYFRI